MPRPVNEETRVNGFSFREYGDGYEVANYLGDETEIEIPDTYKDKSVIGIGARAFSNTEITGITIPDSITTIGPNAFESCKELEEINIPESVTSIGDQAFRYCEGLTAVTMPKNLSYAGEFIFWYCTGLKEITIPDGVTALPYGIFARCNGLTVINIPSSVTSIGVYAFSGLDKITSAVSYTHLTLPTISRV